MSAAAPRPRAAYLGPDRRRPQMLDAALSIALNQGVGAVTIGSVADQIGVTRPVVYSCFSDRVALIEALLARESEVLLAATLNALRLGRNPDTEVAFVRGYQAWLTVVADHPESWRLVFTTHPDPVFAERFAELRRFIAEQCSRQIRPALAALGTQDLDRKLPPLIELFMSSCEAAGRSLLEHGDEWAVEELGELYGLAMWRAFSRA